MDFILQDDACDMRKTLIIAKYVWPVKYNESWKLQVYACLVAW
jgi:hypothetical protein